MRFSFHGGFAWYLVYFFGQDAFEDWNRQIDPQFTAQTYDLLKHNCNNYTDAASQFLLGKGIPKCELFLFIFYFFTSDFVVDPGLRGCVIKKISSH